jgi:CubicO group peptidase (beta-lactamase class C family)
MPVIFNYIKSRVSIVFILCLFQHYTISQTYIQPELADELIDPSIKKIIFDQIEEMPEHAQLSMAFIKNDSVFYLGYIKQNNQLIVKNNIDSIFEIGSISKVFTSTLLAHALIEGKVKKETSINKYLSFKIKDGKKINLLMLSNHTSGLIRLPNNYLEQKNYDPLNPYTNYTEELFIDFLVNDNELLFEPGSKKLYSNLGAGLLGYTLTKVYIKSYENLLQEKIFIPLEMEHTTSNLNNVQLNKVKGLDSDGNIIPNWDLNILSPAGSINSSIKDMTKFLLANFQENKIFNLQKEITYETETEKVAMGWHCIERNDKLIHCHNGSTGGYSSFTFILEKNNIGFTLLSNVDNDKITTNMSSKIMKEIIK